MSTTETKIELPPGIVQVNGFVFDSAAFPANLLEKLQRVAVKLRDLGLEKTGKHKNRSGDVLYEFFEEAELVKHLVATLAAEKVGYAAGTTRITGRFSAYKTNAGNEMWSHYVQCGALFSDSATKEWIIIPGVGEAADSGDKGVTKAITSAIKYILMKTFMISEGNDIEVPREDEHGTKEQAAPAPAKKATTVQNKCGDCKGKIVAIQGSQGREVPAEIVAAKSKEKFGLMLCGACATKRSNAKKERPATETTAEQTEEDGKRIETIAGVLAKKPQKRVVDIKKGKNPGKKTVYDVELPGGVRITDWHASHFEHYEEVGKGDHIKLVVEVIKSGKYTNRNVYALMELGDLCLEDENGKEVFDDDPPSPGQQEGAAQVENNFDESTAFAETDDDIPF